MCAENYYMHEESCFLICPDGYYKDDVLRQCFVCDTTCLLCNGPGAMSCTKCENPRYL